MRHDEGLLENFGTDVDEQTLKKPELQGNSIRLCLAETEAANRLILFKYLLFQVENSRLGSQDLEWLFL